MKVVLPCDSEPLGAAGYDRSVAICDWIARVISERDVYILKNGLDPSTANPNGNWSLESALYDGYRAVASKQYDTINMLRVFTQSFTGSFLGVRNAAGLAVPRTLPPDLDATILNYLNECKSAWWLERYSNLMESLPQLDGLSLPPAFGESGFLIGQAIVNHDLYVYLERIALLLESGVVDHLRKKAHPLIIEIGSGFGGLAYLLKSLLPGCTYLCVDLPESLVFAAIYLTRYWRSFVLFDSCGGGSDWEDGSVIFVPNYKFHLIPRLNIKCDLGINTLSMSEMAAVQVTDYCKGLKRLLGSGGVFFEQNQNNKHIGLIDAKEIIRGHFSGRRKLELSIGVTQGDASLWANSDEALAFILLP